jgi:ABC-type branched-subunit amino acid transport system ATPase component
LLGAFDAGDLVLRIVRRRRMKSTALLTPSAQPVRAPRAPLGDDSLVAHGLGVTFGGFVAVDAVTITVAPGEIRGLIGPNGAGKTTFVNLVTGLVEPSHGEVRLGERRVGTTPTRVARGGVARTFQNLRVFGGLSVRENIAIAGLVARRHRRHRPAIDADALLAASGLTAFADHPARALDYGNQRRLEIARAAALRPDFLLLDEPTSGMSDTESAAMVSHIRGIAEMVGAGVLVIDHDLGFITTICDHVTVLDQGRILAEGTPAEVKTDPAVVAAYLGSHA